MKSPVLTAAFILCLGLAPACARAQAAPDPQLRLPHVFGDNMVLQAGTAAPVWGWAPAGQEVTVSFAGQSVSANAGSDGKWKLVLSNIKQSAAPAVLMVRCADKSIECTNVLVGDIWFGAGQSNMDFPVSGALDAPKFMAQAECPQIRLFRTAINWSETPLDDVNGEWQVCSPQTVASFSATLYFFGREISDKTHLPLGLIVSAVGGQRIEPFIAREGFDATPELVDTAFNIRMLSQRKHQYSEDAMDKIDKIEAWVKEARQAKVDNKPVPLFPPLYGWGDAQPPHRATMLFNANIRPLIPFAIRGVIWYQGEGNWFEQESYAIKLRALVNGWRECWGNPELPFYYVQLPAFYPPDDRPEGVGGEGWQKIRMGQLLALPALGHAGMTVTTDLGDGDLHPKNKQDFGQRLALWALRNEYGQQEIVPSGPLFRSMKIDGSFIRLCFDYAEGGLMVGRKKPLEPVREVKDGTLQRFALAGEDHQWHWAQAIIDGTEVVVTCPQVPHPVAVRYGFTMNPGTCNLYNRNGLPASPFRTDNWFIGWGNY